ncbi:MAG TPA: cysteine desulfurase [Longimicrobiaceae bacterium]|nr:cysteine desulfurase [Longimicrobiaceae bacterium]
MNASAVAADPASAVAPAATLDVERVRAEFPILHQEVNGHPLVYLDNAASTQKPRAVIEAVAGHYLRDNANVHRGLHELSNRSTEAYEDARVRVARFFGIADAAELVWTRGTTEALNLVAWAWGTANLRAGDEILLTVLEHHSNLVPWQLLAGRTGARLRFLDIDAEGRLDLSALDDLLTERTRLVSVGHVSNALGTVNPVREIAERARAVGALVVVDGAQSAPHLPVDVPALGCDFYAFSGHKMCGPTGMGGLWGRREVLEAMPPFLGGGDMIDVVELEGSTWAPLPNKFEAGTPHVAGAVGMGAAVDFLAGVGREAILAHERALLAYALERMAEVPDLRVYGPRDLAERSGVVSFTLADVHPHDLATILDSRGVAIRAGHHCAQPLMRRLGVSSTARASFYLYNTPADVDSLIDGLHHARALFGY